MSSGAEGLLPLAPVFWCVLTLLLTAALCLGVAARASTRVGTGGARPLLALMGSIALWCGAYALELASPGLPAKVSWAQVQWVGIAVVPLAWFVFAVELGGSRAWLRPWTLAALSVLPSAIVAIAFTNGSHGWLWRDAQLQPVGGLVVLRLSHGPAFWVYHACAYVLLGAGAVLLVRKLGREGRLGASQRLAVLAGLAAPWAGNALYVAGLSPMAGLDPTPFAFAGSGLALAWALRRGGLLELVPVAREVVLEQVDDAVLVLDPRGRVVDANPAAGRVLGIPAESLIGRSTDASIGPWPGPGGNVAGATPRRLAVPVGRETRCFEERCLALHDRAGRLAGHAVILSDVTEHARSEERLAALNARLEAALEESRRHALVSEAAASAKADFLARMSHELRTPLNALIGSTHLLLRTPLAPEQRELADTLRLSSRALLDAVNAVLDVSKIEAGRLVLEEGPLPLRAVVEEAVGLQVLEARRKGLGLSVEASPDLPPWVRGDAVRLRQALTNLVTNAVKFTERGVVVVRVTPVGDLVRFEVSDTGIGVDAEALGRIFQPFTQADGSTTRRYGGTGLGLAITRSLAEAMGGTVGASSQRGVGSTFFFTARLPEAEAPAGAAPEPPRPASPRGRRLLLVEDNPLNLKLERAFLVSMGYSVDVAEDGLEAVEAASRQRYDAILMDCQMPLLDGYAATRRIRREDGPNRATPIVALTASSLAGDREKCLAAGMDEHVAKPVEPPALSAALSRVLGRGEAEPAGVPAEPAPAGASSFDVGRIEELRAILPPREIRTAIDEFLERAQAVVAEMREATAAGDAARLQDLLHGLKGTAATLGATELARLCREAEERSRAGHAPGPELVPDVEASLARVRPELLREREQAGEGA